MTRIAFFQSQARNQDVATIEKKLRQKLAAIRNHAYGAAFDPESWNPDDHFFLHLGGTGEMDLTEHDLQKIQRRARRIASLQAAKSAIDKMKAEEKDLLAPARRGVDLISVKSEHQADVIAAELHEEMPWMAAATDLVWQSLRRTVQSDAPGVHLPPLLLLGPPGIGKSAWARRLADIIGLPSRTIDATGEGAGFVVTGLQKGWSSSGPGKPLELILRTQIGNPLIIIDEIEKANAMGNQTRAIANLSESLLSLMEPSTARSWECPAFRLPFDMSWISWVLTANRISGVSPALLSRCHILDFPPLETAHLCHFAKAEGKRRKLSQASIEAMLEAILAHKPAREPMSLRTVQRLAERAAILETRPMMH